jgi:hypothetical protein
MKCLLYLSFVLPMFGATVVEEFRIAVEPAGKPIRPGQTALIYVKSYGRIEVQGQETRRGRLEAAPWKIRIVQAGGGTLSKGFRYQGEDNEEKLRERSSGLMAIFEQGLNKFTVKDSVLYTAPAKEGEYSIEVSGDSGTGTALSAKVEIRVSATAPDAFAAPKVLFPPSVSSADPYLPLVRHHAPFVAQETWFDPRADYLHRFDYDQDWEGTNNWDNLKIGSPQAYVYYAVMETRTHWFLHYNFFHPRDYTDNCVAGTCHENDNEGIILTVKKDGSPFGQLEVMGTLAHNSVFIYTNRLELRPSLHAVSGKIEFFEGTHPVVFLEAGGHGALGGTDRASFFDASRLSWRQNTGVTYYYGGKAEIPSSPTAQKVSYDLLPIYDEWWKKHQLGNAWKPGTFADMFEYRPFGNRPVPENAQFASAFAGQKFAANKARPFWGWFDTKGRQKKVIAPGQWALDPAYSVRQSLRWPGWDEFSLDYTYNPYLGIGR